jgi:hypothetical protein
VPSLLRAFPAAASTFVAFEYTKGASRLLPSDSH